MFSISRLLYFATLVAFQEAVTTQVATLVLALSLKKVFYTVDMILPFVSCRVAN